MNRMEKPTPVVSQCLRDGVFYKQTSLMIGQSVNKHKKKHIDFLLLLETNLTDDWAISKQTLKEKHTSYLLLFPAACLPKFCLSSVGQRSAGSYLLVHSSVPLDAAAGAHWTLSEVCQQWPIAVHYAPRSSFLSDETVEQCSVNQR